MRFGYFTLFVAFVISAVAEYYSIIGLTSIFSAAFWSVVIMGASLGVGKLTATLWLKINWNRSPVAFKIYLVPAVVVLMFLTSVGCFGYLSKAHSDQTLVSGDVTSKIAIYDEKIKTEKENIEANRKALKQMDDGVDQVLGRSTDEKGADKAVALRRSQQKERARLQDEISKSQKSIQELNEARAPIAAEVRKVEAEVGPIKYIAALIYGDNPDANILESAVRWVIILIVAVLDPLALVLVLAGQQSIRWAQDDREEREFNEALAKKRAVAQALDTGDDLPPEDTTVVEVSETWPFPDPQEVEEYVKTKEKEQSILEKHPYLTRPFAHFKATNPLVAKVEEPTPVVTNSNPEDNVPVAKEPDLTVYDNERMVSNFDKAAMAIDPEPPIVTPRNFTDEEIAAMDAVQTGPMKEVIEELIDPNTRIRTLNHKLVPDNDAVLTNSDFGLAFPVAPSKGDSYVRVDTMPTKLYKYNGRKWIELDKTTTDSYISDDYVRYLISKIRTGEYNVDELTDVEADSVRDYLKRV